MGSLVAGCAEEGSMRVVRPGVTWPQYGQQRPPAPAASVVKPPGPTTQAQPASRGPVPQAIPRAQWAKAGPIPSRLNPLGGVTRITVHHEGSTPVWFSDVAGSAQRLELIRQQHVKRGWADIGYHYVIDRAGRVWHARDLRYQGAHVKANNENNVGVMLLGNFDRQSPTGAQLVSLRTTVSDLMAYYRVPISRVYTHQEIMPTACPGRALQPQVMRLRSSGALA